MINIAKLNSMVFRWRYHLSDKKSTNSPLFRVSPLAAYLSIARLCPSTKDVHMFEKSSRRDFMAASAALGLGAVVPQALAQPAQNAKWPNKQIRIVVAFPPGG